MPHRRAHLNLVDSSRQLFELDPGAAVEAGSGWVFGAGSHPHPLISNAAFRIDDGADADQLIARARAFFGERDRGFSLWARAGVPEDRDLIAAAERAGLQAVYEMPEMVLEAPVEASPLRDAVQLRQLSSTDEVEGYWRIAASSYQSLGFPPEVFGHYTDRRGLLANNVAAFAAYSTTDRSALR